MKVISKLLAPYMGMSREIYIIVISKTINAMGALIFPFMTLLLSTKIGLSGAKTGFYIMLMGTFYAPASIIGGKLSDTFGRKKVLIIFELIAAAGYAFCIFLEPSMFMVYILMGASFCFGVAGPSHDAMTADLTTPTQRDGAYSLNYLGFNLGFAFAQIIAGLLFQNHLEIMFLIDAGTAVMAILLIAFLVKETMIKDAGKVQTLPAKTKVPDGHNIEMVDLEARTDKSIISVLFARPTLILFALAAFGYRFVYSQWSFLIPLHAEFNFPTEGAKLFGMMGSFNAVTVVVFTPIYTALLKNRSNIRRIFYAGILFTLGFGMLGLISTKAAFFIAVFVFTTGEILEAVSSMPFIMNHTPASHRGRMSSILPLIMGTGYAIGPMITGAVLDETSFKFTWLMAASVVLIATIGMKLIDCGEEKKRRVLK
ncbi:MAG: MFS transporter [Spirochaetales bacterium]|nr:MFS transporter [Spirochaetales bacterium]